ncbi:MAG: Imm70 family immunity protein [Campylobacterota bacterium]|nr:Imm70 family immunity protein [Campylobacterota bacterium]
MNNIGFLVYTSWTEFGYSETLYSWFSTICYRLEDGEWGSRFPVVMNDLYYNEENGVGYDKLETFKEEIKIIKSKFSKLTPNEAIWSLEDNNLKIPNNMPNINYDAKSLVNFYIKTNSNKNIFDIIYRKIESMEYNKRSCRIVSEQDLLTIEKI